MDPPLFEEFAREFVAAVNRQRADGKAESDARRREIGHISRNITQLVDAIVNGADAQALNARLKEFGAEQACRKAEGDGKKITSRCFTRTWRNSIAGRCSGLATCSVTGSTVERRSTWCAASSNRFALFLSVARSFARPSSIAAASTFRANGELRCIEELHERPMPTCACASPASFTLSAGNVAFGSIGVKDLDVRMALAERSDELVVPRNGCVSGVVCGDRGGRALRGWED